MNIEISRKELNLKTLARKLFEIKGTGATAKEERAVEAIVHANPHLARIDRIPAGTVVAIPNVEGISRIPGVRVDPEETDEMETSIAGLQEALDDARKAMVRAQRERAEADEASLAMLAKSRDELAQLSEAVKTQLPKTEKAIQQHQAELKEREAQRDAELKKLQQGLSIINELLQKQNRLRS
ncbi:MAG: hypothetical protein E1N59_2040 [Puniceicoccaceae bacterium 5H]|nr:MAG: hypothetical protein E1N59_2040 [Puniceicoccaceae bacterium 5H]